MANKEMVVFNCCDSNRRFVYQSGLLATRPCASKRGINPGFDRRRIVVNDGSDMLNVGAQSGTHQVQLTVYRDTARPLSFLDNRIQDRVAGYEVFTEATTFDGSVRMLVNLGWVPGMQRRDELPSIEIPAVFELKGLWVPVTDSYLMSESDAETLGDAQRVQSLTDLIKTNLLPGMVLADGLLPRNANGPKPRLGPETHYGYAIQWFLLALVLCGMTAVILKKGTLRG